MDTKLSGILVDLSKVPEDDRSKVLCAVRDKICSNGAFRGRLDELSSSLFAFDFVRRATDPQRMGALAEINAFLHLNHRPAEVSAF